jgi:predicted nucleic acid-binding protein
MAKTPTNPLIADSSGLVSLASIADHNHAAAVQAATRLAQEQRPIILPAEVFSETINLLGKLGGHAAAYGTAQALLRPDSAFVYQQTDQTLLTDALERFKTQPSGVSFTDCVVMAYADAFQTNEIFGFDKQCARPHHPRAPLP